MSFKLVKLEEACSFVRGLTYSKRDEVDFSSNSVLRATNIDLNTSRLDLTEIRYISDEVVVKEDKKVKLNDIIICTASGSKSHLGKVALVEEELNMAFGGFMGALRVKGNILPSYLFKVLTSPAFKQRLNGLSDGANINNLKFSQICDFEFPLPSLLIQQKMVAKLDTIFAEIDRASAAAESNAKNAEALISSYLNYIFNIKTKNCKIYKLGDVCSFQGGSQPPKSFFEYEPSNSNIRFIQIRDYKSDKNLVYIPKSSARRFCESDEVMIGRYGPPVFQILRGIKGSYNVALMKAVPNEKILTKDYLYYFLKNPSVQDYVISLSNRAAGQSGMNKETIEPYEIHIPSLDDQDKSVIDILTCTDNAQIIKTGSIKKINEMNLLKQSILQQAFNGELVKD